MSDLAKKIVGTFIQDSPVSNVPLVAWTQEECRSGSLRDIVDEFVEKQEEPLEAKLLIVENIDTHGINCVIPCKMFDQESPSSFATEVRLRISLSDRQAQRLEPLQSPL